MINLETIEPKNVFHYFGEISKIPRQTYDMKRISDYCVRFAKDRNLQYVQDKLYNVIIKKQGTQGYEKSDPIILQGHLDMVCEKIETSDHDFSEDPIDVYVEDGFVRAKDTSLGGDDGIAVAYILALLDSNDISHPPIEAVLTVNEEVGMDGAEGIDLSCTKGKMMINLDSEDEGVLLTGCAGGFRSVVSMPVSRDKKYGETVEIKISGLKGGHSGIEIDKQRGNANKLMGRVLTYLSLRHKISLVGINGGSKDNVITSSANTKILVDSDTVQVLNDINKMSRDFKNEFLAKEPDLDLKCCSLGKSYVDALTQESMDKVLLFLNAIPQGVQNMSTRLEGLVETSLNLGIVKSKTDEIEFVFLVRSELESKKQLFKDLFCQWSKLLDGKCEISGDYPSWTYKENSKLERIVVDVYEEMFGQKPLVTTIHAGLECGLLLEKRKDLDCVSFGPQIYDIHSVNERIDISSVQRMWEYLKKVLEKCK